MSFQEILNEYKSNLNLTQSALAKFCGTSPTVISRYLNGQRIPDADSDIIDKIAAGIEAASIEKKLSGNDKSTVKTKLLESLNNDTPPEDFYDKMDALLAGKDISNTELSKVLPYDASYISRVRNRKRKPKDPEEFLKLLSKFLSEPAPEPAVKEEPTKVESTEAEFTSESIPAPEPGEAETSEAEPSIDIRPRKKRMTRFEYFLLKVSTYLNLK